LVLKTTALEGSEKKSAGNPAVAAVAPSFGFLEVGVHWILSLWICVCGPPVQPFVESLLLLPLVLRLRLLLFLLHLVNVLPP